MYTRPCHTIGATVVLTDRRVSADNVPDHLPCLGIEGDQVAVGCATKEPAIGVADATDRRAEAKAPGLEVPR
jgi:hypothetical protein